ncbi:MAG TPA: tyrosine-protein phosphatase [Acidimicrobiales bacterium]|nr:tyrosine-protein phosphatase [Acidimicrobiales bacterium]
MAVNHPKRVIPLEGVRNFRDLGGYPTVDGLITAWDQVYRADSVSFLTQAGWKELAKLNIKRVYDLRRQNERDAWPTIEHGLDHEVVHLPIGSQAAEMSLVEWFTTRGADANWDETYVAETYRENLTSWPDLFARLMTELAPAEHRPAVFHCTAGKDRTGIAAALLLEVLGVNREHILDDYELTNVTRSEARIAELRPELEAAGIDVELVRPYLSAPRRALDHTLDWLAETYGGAEEYLIRHGVSQDTLATLRLELLTNDAA